MISEQKRIPKTPDRPWPFITYMLSHCPLKTKVQAILAFACEFLGTVGDVLVTWILGRIIGIVVDAQPGEDLIIAVDAHRGEGLLEIFVPVKLKS